MALGDWGVREVTFVLGKHSKNVSAQKIHEHEEGRRARQLFCTVSGFPRTEATMQDTAAPESIAKRSGAGFRLDRLCR
jgi:hypothetical protein